ncbi:MAG: hypothetical protein IT305_20250 [Chloroflexi bacterium]|nr:hypothetical protein [Chloroflexota bacterium]
MFPPRTSPTGRGRPCTWTPPSVAVLLLAGFALIAAPVALAAPRVLPRHHQSAASMQPSVAAAGTPDLRVDLSEPGAPVTAGQPFSLAIAVANDGDASSSVRVSTMLPPAASNVTVRAPGFACARQFSASGPDAGTEVTCSRNDLAAGESARMTVEANAPGSAGDYPIVVTATPRTDDPEADMANNRAIETLRVTS